MPRPAVTLQCLARHSRSQLPLTDVQVIEPHNGPWGGRDNCRGGRCALMVVALTGCYGRVGVEEPRHVQRNEAYHEERHEQPANEHREEHHDKEHHDDEHRD